MRDSAASAAFFLLKFPVRRPGQSICIHCLVIEIPAGKLHSDCMEQAFIPENLVFTDAAARKALELILEERNPDLKLRVYISGGGCSGFQYGFMFDESTAEDDIAVTNDGVTLLVDPMSFQYLMGAEVDYTESLQGAQFVIRNPNASTTCGCGSSFSV
jgi:iron-sulfur cluster insertion protein